MLASTLCLKKTAPLLFFEYLSKTLTDFYNFWQAKLQNNLM